MPDKPKRRKNNKNKRKNKNNKNNVNKSNSDVIDTLSVTSSDCQDDTLGNRCEENQSLDPEVKTDSLQYSNLNENPALDTTLLSDVQKLNPYCESESKSDNNDNICRPQCSNVSDMPQIQKTTNEQLTYVVESPDVIKKNKTKLNNGMKSKSVDNDDSPSIVEVTDDNNIAPDNEINKAIVANTNVIITDAESDVEWEKIDELHEITKPGNLSAEAFSVTTIPLEIAHCKETKCLSSDQENSLRCYLQSLNLPTSSNINSLEIKTEIEQFIDREIKQRLRKKGFTEDIFFQRGNISRGLDVIDEEGSSDSSAQSRRHSYLSDKKSDNDDLEDEVFENKPIAFKSTTFSNKTNRKVIPQQCILVDTKLKEPEVIEARGDWSLKTIEKITGAEVVYLTDSSSSTSSLYDVGDDIENDEVSDASIRIITPTIEVTDTEKFLTNTFIPKDKQNLNENNIIIKNSTNDIAKINEDSNDMSQKKDLQDSIETSTQNPHEIIVLSTEDIKTNLFVKDARNMELDVKSNTEYTTCKEKETTEVNLEPVISKETSKTETDLYDLEIKVLKCELNDAINNLIKEVVSDSESISDNPKDTFTRQDSSSSVGSSQCTAKYNPNYSSLNDVSNITHEDNINVKNIKDVSQITDLQSHVKEVFQCVAGDSTQNENNNSNCVNTLSLRDLCVKKIASFPFGNKILEELAHVSERLSVLALHSKEAAELLKDKIIEKPDSVQNKAKMPYFPLPDISNIEKVSLSTKIQEYGPPPVQPRNSSLRKTQDESHWTAIPTTAEPVYVCLSPSQKMLMEKTNTVIRKEDATQLIDTHKKFVDRRGYNENFKENIDSSPIVPFKSQTGSRLMALIRDPSVTNNVNLSANKKHSFKSMESLPVLHNVDIKDHSKEKNMSDKMTHSKSFKPVPPPRPRKFSSSFYESDESSDFTDNSFRSMRSAKKIFHYSTGNLNKEIENDVSSIQNMHRYYSNLEDSHNENNYPRRPSLPKDLCDQQMEYIRRKEKEVEEEIKRLEQEKTLYPEKKVPRPPLITDRDRLGKELFELNNSIRTKKDILFSDPKIRKETRGKLSSVFSKSQEELLREKMYSEYVSHMAEREQRRQQKFIKITSTPACSGAYSISKSMPTLDALESKVNNRIEKEFICRARERWHKLGIEDPVTEDESELTQDIYREPKVIEHKIKVIQAGEEKDVTNLPSHLQEFVSFTAKSKEQEDGRTGESVPEREPTHVVVFCAVIILVLAVSKFFWRFLQNKR